MENNTAHLGRIHTIKPYLLPVYIFIFLCTWVWTFVAAYDLYVWLLENILLFILVTGAVVTYRKYPLSRLSYSLLITFLLLHLYGARYTYENNPLGIWLQTITAGERNSYDRIVHFAFGLLWTYPVYALIRKQLPVNYLLACAATFCIITTLASFYEILEWVIGGIFFPEQGTAFVGLQGDPWDAQKDIALAALGSLITLGILVFIKRKEKTCTASNTQEF
jgi:putative membrane protein